jgi:hypothetical protein
VGLFDSIRISADVGATWKLACQACGAAVLPSAQWQTKSLCPGMSDYFLRYEGDGIRLFLLDRPSDRRYFRAWSPAEIAESQKVAHERGDLFAHWIKKEGEGEFMPPAFDPANRRQRHLGELPHQWVEMYTECCCGEWVERWLKFTDGVVHEVRDEAPATPEDGGSFFDR